MLPRRFYERPAPAVARDLVGCILISRLGGTLTAGRIVETEAYLGPEDGASHAAFRPGSRWLFYGPGGIAYVFLAYGLHACLNAIAGPAGTRLCADPRPRAPRGDAGDGAATPAAVSRTPSLRALAALTSGPARLTRRSGSPFATTAGTSGRSHSASTRRRATKPRVVASRRIGISRSPGCRSGSRSPTVLACRNRPSDISVKAPGYRRSIIFSGKITCLRGPSYVAPHRPASTAVRKSSTARLNASGSSRLIVWPDLGITANQRSSEIFRLRKIPGSRHGSSSSPVTMRVGTVRSSSSRSSS